MTSLYFLTGLTECQKEYLEATSGPALIGRFIPKCRTDGSYAPVQCHGSTGFCWCVTKDGKEIANTRIRGQPKCEFNIFLKCPTFFSSNYSEVNHASYIENYIENVTRCTNELYMYGEIL